MSWNYLERKGVCSHYIESSMRVSASPKSSLVLTLTLHQCSLWPCITKTNLITVLARRQEFEPSSYKQEVVLSFVFLFTSELTAIMEQTWPEVPFLLGWEKMEKSLSETGSFSNIEIFLGLLNLRISVPELCFRNCSSCHNCEWIGKSA